MKLRFFPFFLLLVLAFLGLWLKLFWLQIVKGEENKELTEGNRIKIVKVPAPRGVIYDRQGQILVRNRPEGREYIYGEAFAHVLGYLGEASKEDFRIIRPRPRVNYSTFPQQEVKVLVGKMGIEKEYDQVLRGEDGGILVETDAAGEVVREIKKQEPKEGKSLTLTLDLGLQKKAFESLKGRKGAVVVSDPRTGEILALVSSPSFDPNIFSLDTSGASEVLEVLSDSGQPLFNRAIAGLYPPGSTFKIVTAIAGLEEGKIDKSTLVEDTGEIKIGRFVFGNWYFYQYGKTEGMVDIIKAIKRSNDIYFYKVGEWLGITKLAEWAKFFGLGQPLGIDIPGEAGGLIPTPEWKKENKTERWYLGDTYITAIGQGDLQLTPLQVNQMAAVIASEGKLCRPHLLKEIIQTNTRPLSSLDNFCQDLKISDENLKLVKEGMKQACEPGGTGWPFFEFTPRVGCKTGTAEYGDPQDRTHAWFTVFAPWDKPEIVLTVLLEGAGEGSYQAAPVAKELLKYWFEKSRG